jgi:hypothetical protein
MSQKIFHNVIITKSRIQYVRMRTGFGRIPEIQVIGASCVLHTAVDPSHEHISIEAQSLRLTPAYS